MLDLLFDILLAIAEGVLLLGVGWLLRGAYSQLHLARPLSKVLGSLADQKQSAVIVVPRLHSDTDNIRLRPPNDRTEIMYWPTQLPLLAESDAKAMMYVYNSLLKCRKEAKNLDIKSDGEVLGTQREGNLVCIGAVSNSLTREFLATVNPHLNFVFNVTQMRGETDQVLDTSIADRKTEETWTRTKTHDYGLIFRLKNPSDKEKNVIILAGLGPAGTIAAGYYFSIHWRQIYNFLKIEKSTNGNYAVLLRTRIADPTDINRIKISTLQ